MKRLITMILSLGWFTQPSYSQQLDSVRLVSDQEFYQINSIIKDPAVGAKSYLDSARLARRNHENYYSVYFLSIVDRFLENSKNDTLTAELHYSLGTSYKNLYMLDEAVTEYSTALKSFMEIKDTSSIATCYNRLGILYKELNQYTKAVESYNYANQYYFSMNDSTGMGLIRLNIGNIFKNTGQPNLAKKEYFAAIRIFEDQDDKDNVANCLNNLGNVYKNEGNYDSAFYYMYKTIGLRKKSESQLGLAYVYHNISNLHLLVNNPDSALIYIANSLDIKKKMNNKVEMAMDYEVYGRIYMKKSLWNLAIEHFNKALSLLEHLDNEQVKLDVRKNLAYAYYRKGDYRNASENFVSYIELKDSIDEVYGSNGLEHELIQYQLVSDSLRTNQLILQKELTEEQNKNQDLQSAINQRSLLYLIVIFGLIFASAIIMVLSYRKRLNETREHEAILQDQNEELKRTLISKEEKEILLKEIHHRVKNNLQIINSLVRLQSNYMNAANYKEKLIETENRIRSMALIHEKLYKSKNLAKLSVRNYVEELSINILDSYERETRIKLHIDVEECEYGIDSLIPIGFIITETLSNSIKHAFFDRPEGAIYISLKTENEKTILRIWDDGLGADMSFEDLKEDSLGMELIESLTDQLDGKIDLDTSNGFSYIFEFPKLV